MWRGRFQPHTESIRFTFVFVFFCFFINCCPIWQMSDQEGPIRCVSSLQASVLLHQRHSLSSFGAPLGRTTDARWKDSHSCLMRVPLYKNIPRPAHFNHIHRQAFSFILLFPGFPTPLFTPCSISTPPSTSDSYASPPLASPLPRPSTSKAWSQIKLNTIPAKVCTCFLF